jgi:hypothetical protein
MLVRVLTAHVAQPNVGEANVRMRDLLAELRAQPGLAYVKLARRFLNHHEEIILFEEWRTPADLFRWTGGDLHRPRLLDGMPQLFENLVITHYESLDVVPEELDLDVIHNGDAQRAEGAANGQ